MNNPYDVKPEEVKQEKPAEPNNLGVPADSELEKIHLAESLGLKNIEDIKKFGTHLDRLVEWAKVKGAKSREDVVWQVRQLANMVGGPNLGNNMAQHLSTFAYLEMEKLRIEKQMKEMSVNG